MSRRAKKWICHFCVKYASGTLSRDYELCQSGVSVSRAGSDEYPLPDPELDPNYFSQFRSLGFLPAGYFPPGRFKSSNYNPQILLFTSRPDTKSSVSKVKCFRYKKWIQGKSGKFDNWFMMHFDLFQSRQSNPRFIHVEAIKSINQDGDKLLSNEAHAL